MKVKSIFLVFFLISFVFSNDLFSQQRNNENRRQQSHKNCNFHNSLSEEQKEQIKAVRLQSHIAMQEHRDDLQIQRAKLAKIKLADDASQEQIEMLVKNIADQRSEIMRIKIDADREILNLLDDEQKDIYRLHSKRKGKAFHGKKGTNHSCCTGNNKENMRHGKRDGKHNCTHHRR